MDAEDQIPAIMDEQIEEDIQMEVPSGGDDYGDHNQGNRPLVDQVQREQDMIDAAMKEMADFDRQSDYVHFANSEIQKWIMPRRTIAVAVFG